MTAYYNEIDRFACDWLSNLMDAGLITPGKIDDRSIHDVGPDDVAGFERVHFFAGIGGWDHALNLAGWQHPVWTGSCPCQPFSQAGRRAGFADERHLWPVWRELIRECDPAIVLGEQVASASDWLRLVRSDLEAMGRAVGAIPFEAASAGADHLRDRYGFVAYANDARLQGWPLPAEGAYQWPVRAHGVADEPQWGLGDKQPARQQPEHEPDAPARDGGYVAHANGEGEQRRTLDGKMGGERGDLEWVVGADGKARRVKSGIRLLVDAFPNRMGLLRGFGNAIDPEAFAQFIAAAGEAMSLTLSLQESGAQHE